MFWIGLDVGTTGCKAGVFSDTGELVSLYYREYPLQIDGSGKAELDSRLVLQEVHRVIKQAASEVGGKVGGMCISSQGEAITPVDKKGNILCNGMVSSDSRPYEECRDWNRFFPKDRLYKITGHTAQPMFSLFKILWIRNHYADIWSEVYGLHCYEDLIHLSLGIEPAMSYPMAGRTVMFDIHKHEWSDEILTAAGISKELLPRTLQSGSIVGEIPADIAAGLGLNPGVKVIAGGHDQTIGALGAGVHKPGYAMYATGTVECVCSAFSDLHLTEELMQNNLNSYDFSLPGMSTCIGFSLTGGNILQWYKDNLGREEVSEAERLGINPYENILQSMPEKPSSLLVIPYFTATGTPYFDVNTPGVIYGLRMSTGKEDIVRGLLEGVAMEMRLNIALMRESGITFDKLIMTGGGARNDRWNQLKADVLGLPLIKSPYTETGCYGASLLARMGVTGESIEDLSTVKFGMEYIPNNEYTQEYDGKFEKYKRMYSVIKNL